MGAETLFLMGSVAAFLFFAVALGGADYYTQDVREKRKR